MGKKKIYNAERICKIFENLGYGEWKRFEGSAYNRFLRDLHIRELKKHIKKGMEVLDLGSGPGRFSIELIKLGAKVTLVDISQKQLTIAKRKISRAGLQKGVRRYVCTDATSMSDLEDSAFDFILAFGGLLSFVVDKREDALSEIRRVLKPNGYLLSEVVSRYGVFRECVSDAERIWKDPKKFHVWKVIETGTQPWKPFWALHFYTSDELKNLLEEHGFDVIDMYAVPSVAFILRDGVKRISRDKKALETLYKVEEILRNKPGMIDSGQFIIGFARKR
jgi:ubiquinone/menaquinone biosynthesis C-methylase UbiE